LKRIYLLSILLFLLSSCSAVITENNENLKRFDLIATSSPNFDKAMRSYLQLKINVVSSVKKQPVLIDLPKDTPIFEAMDKGQNTKINAIIKPNGACLVEYEGHIGPENYQHLLKAMLFTEKYKCKEKLLKLSSTGGKVVDGIRMGILVGILKWDTMAWKTPYIEGCASSCTYPFLAGKKRYGANKVIFNRYETGKLSFHQMSNKDICVEDYENQVALMTLDFLKEFNPDASLIIYSKMMSVDCKRLAVYNFYDRNLELVFNADFTKEDYEKFKYK
jgi:hypothetical protein